MGFKLFFGVFCFLPTFVLGCDFSIDKVSIPIDGSSYPQNLCLDDYFSKRDLAHKSLKETDSGQVYMFNDTENLIFDDMLLFKVDSSSLGENGRLELVKKIYNSYLNSLKNEYGNCSLQIFDENKNLTVNDFVVSQRDESGQPGTRIMLTKDDVKAPHWTLNCPNSNREQKIFKSGNYFFVFVDVYENTSPQTLKDNLAQFLFAFR